MTFDTLLISAAPTSSSMVTMRDRLAEPLDGGIETDLVAKLKAISHRFCRAVYFNGYAVYAVLADGITINVDVKIRF